MSRTNPLITYQKGDAFCSTQKQRHGWEMSWGYFRHTVSGRKFRYVLGRQEFETLTAATKAALNKRHLMQPEEHALPFVESIIKAGVTR